VSGPWRVVFTKAAQKDARKVAESGLKGKDEALIDLLREDPFRTPPPYEKLICDLAGEYSRRINRQHRLIYSIHKDERTVRVLRMWTHYE
jgi:Txe/YoeB family toxin of toxin-antitoxin system